MIEPERCGVLEREAMLLVEELHDLSLLASTITLKLVCSGNFCGISSLRTCRLKLKTNVSM